MNAPLLAILAQVEPDLQQVSDSGISEVSTTEWILAGGVFLAAIALAIFARRVVERLINRTGPPPIARLGGRLAAFLIVVLGFFYALTSVDVAVGPLLGGLGIVGIALAFSLQEILGNFAAGVLLQTRRPIQVGDQIVTNGLEGEVADVNFRSVELHTFDGETIYVPNSMVLQNPITNWTKTPRRRTTLAIGVAYDSDLAEVQRLLVEAVGSCEGVLDDPAPEALVYEFSESSINLALRVWHGATIAEMWGARDAAAQAVKAALDEHGFTMPFPQRTLWFGPDNTELRIRGSGRDRDPDPEAGPG